MEQARSAHAYYVWRQAGRRGVTLDVNVACLVLVLARGCLLMSVPTEQHGRDEISTGQIPIKA